MPFDLMMPKGYIRMNVGTRNDLKTFDFFKTVYYSTISILIYITLISVSYFAYKFRYVFF